MLGTNRQLAVCALVAAIALVAELLVYESQWLNWQFLFKFRPEFQPYHIVRSSAFFALAGLLAALLARDQARPLGFSKLTTGSIAVVSASALGLVVMFLVDPFVLSLLLWENGVTETMSAIALFVASGMVFMRWRHACRHGAKNAWVWVVFSGVFLLIGLEEVSWFQQLFGFATPSAFEANFQNETNIHNFATHEFEFAYYIGAFLFLFLFPAIAIGDRAVELIGEYRPSRTTALITASMVGFNWETWITAPIQVSVFLTLSVLVIWLAAAVRAGRTRDAVLLGLVLLAVTGPQVALLADGGSLYRRWDGTELKEFFIALGILSFAFDAVRAMRTDQSSSTV